MAPTERKLAAILSADVVGCSVGNADLEGVGRDLAVVADIAEEKFRSIPEKVHQYRAAQLMTRGVETELEVLEARLLLGHEAESKLGRIGRLEQLGPERRGQI
jgi:hypothetical protein